MSLNPVKFFNNFSDNKKVDKLDPLPNCLLPKRTLPNCHYSSKVQSYQQIVKRIELELEKVNEFISGFGCYLTNKTMPRVFWRGTYFQPFAVKLFPGIWRKHNRFLVKTVMVQNNDVDTAFHLLNRLMEREGLMKIIRNTVRYQKPYMQRNQLSMEASNAILEEDRDRKFKFLVRKHRADAYPGQLTM